MKVCTDACLFGAWVGDKIDRWGMTDGRKELRKDDSGEMTDDSRRMKVDCVLDIGSGTGLLSLILAQKTGAAIDAVELDDSAAEQSAENFASSNWKNRLQVIKADIRTVHLSQKYDLIISNPPFFENDLESGDSKRNIALHSKELNFHELISVVKKNLAANGKFAVLLPWHRKNEFKKIALAEGFFLEEEIAVKQTTGHAFFRAMLLFATDGVLVNTGIITIHENAHYSAEFTRLLKDYYLKL